MWGRGPSSGMCKVGREGAGRARCTTGRRIGETSHGHVVLEYELEHDAAGVLFRTLVVKISVARGHRGCITGVSVH